MSFSKNHRLVYYKHYSIVQISMAFNGVSALRFFDFSVNIQHEIVFSCLFIDDIKHDFLVNFDVTITKIQTSIFLHLYLFDRV